MASSHTKRLTNAMGSTTAISPTESRMRAGTILWFRNDLRLTDHPALTEARGAGGPLLPVFIWSPDEEGAWAPGAASRWWLHRSLKSLDERLRKHGSRLLLRRGPAAQALRELARETGAQRVFFTRRYEPAARKQEATVRKALVGERVDVRAFSGSLLYEPETICNLAGRPFQVFTQYWKTCLKNAGPTEPLAAPRTVSSPRRWPVSLTLDELNLEPAIDWAAGLRETWQPGETGATERLERFIDEALAEYPALRDRPATVGTSRLSPHLHFGEIGPRQIWHAVRRAGMETREPRHRGEEAYLRELGWREFAHHLLWHFPHTPRKPLREAFEKFPWRKDAKGLEAWRRGRTGYPLVDAGMRELWRTGWMHNRVRMVVASFLVKDLRLHWLEGARWFWDTLVDADLANNTLGWQWSSGCGADAAPYFRIFNPVLQGEKFDPRGAYVRRWVPELAKFPDRCIHRPWDAADEVLWRAGTRLGHVYPLPVVDHGEARDEALAAFASLRRT